MNERFIHYLLAGYIHQNKMVTVHEAVIQADTIIEATKKFRMEKQKQLRNVKKSKAGSSNGQGNRLRTDR